MGARQFGGDHAAQLLQKLISTPGIEIRVKHAGAPLMHLKSYQIDGRWLRTGAANFSASGLKRQDNDLLVIDSATAAAAFERRFETMFVQGDALPSEGGAIAVNATGLLPWIEPDSLISLLAQNFKACPEQNRQVKSERPVINIPKICAHALRHLMHGSGFPSQAVNLGPACHARLHGKPVLVTGDQGAVFHIVGDRMRTRADQGHVALQHIQKLRQLVDARPAQEFTDTRYAQVAASCLNDVRSILEHRHRPEFVDDKLFAVEAVAPLLEDHRAFAIKLDCDRGQQKNRPKNGDRDSRDKEVQNPLRRALDFIKP